MSSLASIRSAGSPCLVVFGAGGQLGQALLASGPPPGWVLRQFHHSQLNITDQAAIADALHSINQGVVVNLAAYTNVDQAETDNETAFAVNAKGAGLVAAAAALRNLPVIHLSTDYVFAGDALTPYDEEAKANPISVYGASKLAGEVAVRNANPQHFILRTSWLFSQWGRNFWRSIISQAQKNDEVKVVEDQSGCPTSANDLAEILKLLAPRLLASETGAAEFGTFHLCGDEPTTWFDFAKAILMQIPTEKRPKLTPISSAILARPAQRPAYSVLDSSKFTRQFGLCPPSWRQALSSLKTP
jgi:dTDP-4-dehydrorhamnose reductase